MKRGFTLVEILIVVIVLSIVAGIVTVSYTAIRNDAADSQAQTMVSLLNASLDKYYSTNNQYPLAADLFGGNPNGTVPSSYSTAAQLLGVSESVFKQGDIRFMPCSSTGGSMSSVCSYQNLSWVGGIENVKYITKSSGELNVEKQYFVASPNGPNTAVEQCEIVIRNTIEPSSVYVMTYWSREEQKVKFVKSTKGEVSLYSPMSGQCVFTAP